MSESVSNVRSLNRKRRQKNRKRLLIGIVIFALAAVLIYVAYFSTLLTVKKITVIGNSIATSISIASESEIQIGTQLARVNSDEVNQNLSDIPSIDQVEVRRVWPNEIILVVTERVAIGTIKVAGHWEFVDQNGVAYGKTFNQPKDLMVFDVKQKLARVEVAKIYKNAPAWLISQIKSIGANSRDNVKIGLSDNRTVIFGDSSRIERKLAVLKVLLTKKARIYDVSAPDVPVTRK